MNKTILTALLSASILSACNNEKKEEPTVVVIDKEQVKKEIQAKEDTFAMVYNSGVTTDVGYYADDAVSYFQNRTPIEGKPAIIDFMKSNVESNTDRISFTTKEVFVSPDGLQVLEIGAFKVVDSANVSINTGNYMSYFEKRNGRYVAVRDMSTSDGSLPK